MTYRTIGEIFDAFQKLKVLIVGDVMVDDYTYGTINRLSPEAPVPVVDINKKEKRLGGAANVALNVAALGASPFLCSVVGQDAAGKDFFDLMKAANLSTSGIFQSADRMTTVKHRVMASGKHILRLDQEDSFELTGDESNYLIERIDALIHDMDLIIMQDYDKGVMNSHSISHIISQANEIKIPITVDPKFRNYFAYESMAMFKPNLKEFLQNINENCADDTELIQLIEKWRLKSNHERILVTLSERGIAYSDQNQRSIIPSKVRAVSDVSGAGDTVIAIGSLGVALELPTKLIAELANLGGGIVCEREGVIPIDKNQLMKEALSLKM